MDPVTALREIAFLLERSRAESFKVKAFRRAAAAIDALSEADRARHAAARSWGDIEGLGATTAAVAAQAADGRVPDYLAKLRAADRDLAEGGGSVRALLRGDLHTHTDASDGTASLEEMVVTAQALGHEYLAVTDHSPRLTVARGLSAERLAAQGEHIDALNPVVAPLRILRGIEVDIHDDGSLDQTPVALAALDVVVASVHSKLGMDREAMTRRMVAAIANPRTNVLGHVTGRLVEGGRGTRAESQFDAEVVFEACRTFGVAVEINSRPERRDPPTRLLHLARDIGCLFAIDTDAHGPGQLDFLAYGAERAEAAGIDPDRIITTWPLERLLDFTRPGASAHG